MIVFPNAKINIGLHIVEKREDGFHNIETMFYPIGLSDVLEVIENKNPKGNSVEFSTSGIDIPGKAEENICIKIFEKIKQDYDLPAIKIHLHKIIPIGAGLGGGSSDAAFFIKAIDSLFKLELSEDKKFLYSEFAGSDCSFFIKNKTAFAEGKGEIILPLPIDLNDYYLVLLNPQIHISTAEAYSGVTTAIPQKSLKELIAETSIENWRGVIKNDFEKHIFKKHPVLNDIKENLYSSNAVYASMSGSGSSMYGIFRNKPELKSELKKHIVWEEDLKV
ncbi:MAG: 4-(cytidine 5'-diphospho)-2-C-methyl-D-erythritol kinase [Bacteroidota bacterium]|nr:4-(cytidine 5'-diphospho)-2-C-methyl-D-erythritol kinase [Bacteroidota bacterium]